MSAASAPATYVRAAALSTLFTPACSPPGPTRPSSRSWPAARLEALNSTGSVTMWNATATA